MAVVNAALMFALAIKKNNKINHLSWSLLCHTTSSTRTLPLTAFYSFNAVCATEQGNICQSSRVVVGLRACIPLAKGTSWKSQQLMHAAVEIRRDQHLPELDSRPDEKRLETSEQIIHHKPVNQLGWNYHSCDIFSLDECDCVRVHTVCAHLSLRVFACVWQCVS